MAACFCQHASPRSWRSSLESGGRSRDRWRRRVITGSGTAWRAWPRARSAFAADNIAVFREMAVAKRVEKGSIRVSCRQSGRELHH
jgi:hypothetical protein